MLYTAQYIMMCSLNGALVISSEEEYAVPDDITNPLQDLIDCVLFALYRTLTELNGIQSTRCKLKLKLSLLFTKEEDSITAVVIDSVNPARLWITADFEAN